ncbi:MAG: hypothetical protein AVDCRST_MAG52-2052 [uncultured Blastococcus sp.]|uniref:Uncharacterized protein n=1 Tax=uncultured Blastococcus sp. TaxID=217144 RepID=A0A6J4IEZ3_9ACTN|nr:MAG: hypothetical protein AVDCRST_MAG52-2052 [uncultured Blastococcus sp.]
MGDDRLRPVGELATGDPHDAVAVGRVALVAGAVALEGGLGAVGAVAPVAGGRSVWPTA